MPHLKLIIITFGNKAESNLYNKNMLHPGIFMQALSQLPVLQKPVAWQYI